MILELEKQVVSLEIAKRLKELGCCQNSIFYWITGNGYDTELSYGRCIVGYGRPDAVEIAEHYSAYTTAELGELLPRNFSTHEHSDGGFWIIEGLSYECECCGDMKHILHNFTISITEAEARSLMLIYLLENKLMEIKTCQ